jgi:hypothetical protein
VQSGPATKPLPSVMEKLLLWQGQLMTPFAMLFTAHPWWVQVAEKALNSPAVGCVTTTFRSPKTFPPPSGMSAVLASAAPAAPSPPADGSPLAPEPSWEPPEAPEEPVGADEPDASSSDPPHAVSATASPAAPAAATTVRRAGPDVGLNDALVMLRSLREVA